MRRPFFRALAIAMAMTMFVTGFSSSTVRAEENDIHQDVNENLDDISEEKLDQENSSSQEEQADQNVDDSVQVEEDNGEESIGTEKDKEFDEDAVSEKTEAELKQNGTELLRESEQNQEYIEENDLANSFRFVDGEPIQSTKRYTEYATWPTNIPGTVGYGIDVSEHQGKIDWNKVKNAGVDFAIIRCGYGQDQTNQDDDYWEINAKACEQYDIPYGTYLYSYADTVAKAKSEAQHMLRLIKGRNLSYPIYYDLEESSVREKLSKTQIADIAEAFCDVIESAGYEVAIYANKDWFTNYLTDKRFDQWDKWVAQYNTECDYNGEYSMWQCSSKGQVSGITGNVDLNIDLGAALNYNDGPQLVSENGKTYCYQNGEQLFGEQNVDGYWYYFDEERNGEMVTGWYDVPVNAGGTKRVYYDENGRMTYGEKQIGGHWYYFHKTSGAMQTGFIDLPGKTVYYNEEGQMEYGEIEVGGYNYYLNYPTGKRLEEEWREITDSTGTEAWIYYDEEGRQVYGEKRIDTYWYYFDEKQDGKMVTGWYDVPVNAGGTKRVYYDENGRMTYGEKQIGGHWYYFHKTSGAMQTGFIDLPGKTVYYNEEGQMEYGEIEVGGYNYYLNYPTGKRLEEEWREITDSTGTEAWIYYDEEGRQVYGEKRIDTYWYYFDEKQDGKMVTGWYDVPVNAGGTKRVYYDENGRMTYGEKQIDGYWYYFNIWTGERTVGWGDIPINNGKTKTVYYNKDGKMVYGEQKIDGYWYYFDRVTGEKVTNKTIGNHYYDSEGKRTK